MTRYRALALLAIAGFIILDLANAQRPVANEAPDAYIDPFEGIDGLGAASVVSQVAIIRSDNEVLPQAVPITERLTRTQIRDMVYAALEADRDWESGRPRLATMIADTRQAKGTCWVSVKSNLIGYPGRALYTQGDQTDIRVTAAVMTYLADSTDATRISMLACGGYRDDYRQQDILQKSIFASSGLRWNSYFWDLPDEFSFQDVLDELSARHPDKIIEGINLNYDEIMTDGQPYSAHTVSDNRSLGTQIVPVPVDNGIGALPTTNVRRDSGYVPTAAICYSDLIVNVPVMKTTGKVGVNGVLKNYVGSVSRGVYASSRGGSLGSLDHGPATEDFTHTLEKTVVNLFSYHPSDYVVFDALVGLEGDGSHPKTGGRTGWVRRNFVMAGGDPIAMDAIAARSMGLNPRDLDILLWGRAKGWGQFEPERIRIVGNRLDEVQTDLMHPVEYTNYTAGYYYGRGNRRWLINGPFPGGDLNVDHLGNEARANPAAGDDAGEGALWRPHQSAASYVDLWQMYQGDLDESTVYAFTRAYSDREQRGELWVGATKGIAVYVNGELVVSERTTGGHAWKGVTHPVQLVAGDNRILVKVTHVLGRNFGFSLALVDDGLNSERTHFIPHTGHHELGEPIAFTDETRRKFFGGDTLPGLRYHVTERATTAIETSREALPDRPALYPACPNPFNATTVLNFDMPTTADAQLIIYDTLGRVVRTLADGTQAVGYHTTTWDGGDDAGREVASGIYIARITVGALGQSQRMALVR